MIIQEAQSDGLLLPIYHSCLALNVSRNGCYEWLRRSEKTQNRPYIVNHKRVLRFMRQEKSLFAICISRGLTPLGAGMQHGCLGFTIAEIRKP